MPQIERIYTDFLENNLKSAQIPAIRVNLCSILFNHPFSSAR